MNSGIKNNINIYALSDVVQHKILKSNDLDELFINSDKSIAEHLGCSNKLPLVFTNGVFDILHTGHLTYLAQAKSLGHQLIIGLNSDASTKMLEKGNNRPINNEIDRQVMLASLFMIDYIVIFSEKTPIELLKKIKPHIYVKGGDYSLENLPETPVVQSWGGIVKILSFVDGYSTTSVLNKIRKLG